ncbi:hypothetical protein GCAAIG_14035 [Candidatus Electronema halotolerans]
MKIMPALLRRPVAGMLAVFLLTALPAAALMLLLQRPLFEARAQIAVSKGTDLPTMLALLRGNVLAEKTLAAVGPEQLFPALSDNERIRQLQRQLNVRLRRKSRLIEISFRHSDQKLAADTVNALLRLVNAPGAAENSAFKEQLAQAQQEVVQAETKLAMLMKNAPRTVSQPTAARDEQQAAAGLEERLTAEQTKQEKSAAALAELRQRFAALAGDAEDKDDFLSLKLYEQELLRKYDESEPLVASVRRQLAQITARLEKGSATDSQAVEELARQVVRAAAALSAQEEIVATMQRQLHQLQGRNKDVAAKQEISSSRLQDELAASKARLAALLNQMDTPGQQAGQSTIVERPLPPLQSVRPNKLRLLVAAVCFGLLCCLLLHVLRQESRPA